MNATTEIREPQSAAVLRPQFPVLDAMRAVGALLVVLTHVGFWAGAYANHGYFGVLLARADVGVAIFFVLSGFLLSMPWLSSAALDRRPPGLGRYAWKRALRIFPIYLVTVVIALSLLHDNADLGWRDWLKTFAMLNIYLDPHLPAGLTQMWSLATELAFYVVLPLLMWLATSPRLTRGPQQLRPRRVALLLLVMVGITVCWYQWWSAMVPSASTGPVNEWLPATLDWFAAGVALALLFETVRFRGPHGRVSRPILTLARHPGVCWMLATGLVLVAATPLAGPTMLAAPSATQALTKNLLYMVIATLVILPGVFAQPGTTYTKVFSQRHLRRLGLISYGIFCLHLPILHFVMWSTGFELFRGNFWPILGLTVVLSVVAAEVAYRLIEEPFMRLRALGRSTKDPASTQPSATNAT